MNFAAFSTGLAIGFALLLFRRDLVSSLFDSLSSAAEQAKASVNAASGAGCTSICTGCEPKVLTPQELSSVPFSPAGFKGITSKSPGSGAPSATIG